MCTCISTCMHVTSHSTSALPLSTVACKLVCPCGPICISHAPLIWSYTLVRMCTCIRTCMHVHLTPHICSMPVAQLHTNMCTTMWPDVHVPVSPHLVPLFCQNVNMHQNMYACPPSSPCLLHSLCIVAWKYVHPYVPPCVLFQSSFFWSHTLVRACTCTSTCMNVHMTPHSCYIPMHSCIKNVYPVWPHMCVPVMAPVSSQVTSLIYGVIRVETSNRSFPFLIGCIYIYVCVCMYIYKYIYTNTKIPLHSPNLL